MKRNIFWKRGISAALFSMAFAAGYAQWLMPMGTVTPWNAKYIYAPAGTEIIDPANDANSNLWYSPDYDDSQWGHIVGPIGYGGYDGYQTTWEGEGSTYWLRVVKTINNYDPSKTYCIKTHSDDNAVVYINGVKVQECNTEVKTSVIEDNSCLREGENVIAIRVSDACDSRFIDFGIYARVFLDGIDYNILDENTVEVGSYNNEAIIDGTVTIPSAISIDGKDYTVVSIGNNCFIDCPMLKHINLPNTIREIKENAFNNTGLEEIIIPEGVINIKNYSFTWNYSVKRISLPSTLRDITISAFWALPALEQIELASDNQQYTLYNGDLYSKDMSTLLLCPANKTGEFIVPEGVRTIESNALSQCSGITSLVLPNSLERFAYEGFPPNAESVNIPKNLSILDEPYRWACVNSITIDPENEYFSLSDDGALLLNKDKSVLLFCKHSFEGEVNIPSTVKTIKEGAFRECNFITSINIPEGVTTIEGGVFDCESLKELRIPESVTSLNTRGLCSGCSNLETFVFPSGIKIEEIDDCAFRNCHSLKSIVIPEGVKRLGFAAFEQCYKLEVMELPSTLENFGCGNLWYLGIGLDTKVICHAQNPPMIEGDFAPTWGDFTLYVPQGSKKLYQDAEGWRDFPHIENITAPTTDIASMDNVIYVDDMKLRSGKSAVMHLNLKNSTELTAMEFNLVLPEGMSIDKNARDKYDLKFNSDTERTDASTHNLSATDKDGCVYVLCYSNSNDTFLGSEGAVIDIPVTLAEGMEPEKYNIYLKDVLLTAPVVNGKAQEFKYDEIVATLEVPGYIMGDANADEEVNVTDIVYIVNHLQGNSADDFEAKAADLNEDGQINVTDIVYLVNYLQTGNMPDNGQHQVKARKAAPVDQDNILYMDDVTIDAGQSTTLELCMKNSAEITAMEFSMVLPDGVTVDKNRRGKYDLTFNADADRTDNTMHNLSGTDKDGAIYVLCYSNDNDVFYDNDGAIMNIPITVSEDMAPGVYDIKLCNVILTGTVQNGKAPEYKYDEIVIKLNIPGNSFDLADGSEYSNASQQVSNVTYTRNFKNTDWQPLYVPFSMGFNDWDSQGLEVARLNGYYEYDNNKDGEIDAAALEILIVEDGEGTLKPNHPYMVRAKSTGEKTISLQNATIYASESNSIDCSTMETKYTFTGIYDIMTMQQLNDISAYVMGGGSLHPSTSDLGSFRWYMIRENRGGQLLPAINNIKVFVHGEEDTTDAINHVNLRNIADGDMYNLMGQKVNANAKGIVIINGKKYLKK